MNKKYNLTTAKLPGLAISALLAVASIPAAYGEQDGGISLGSTRVIYTEKSPGATVRVINTSKSAYLIQSWIDNFRGEGGWEKEATLPVGVFVVTPPLFRLDTGENNILIRRAGGNLPADRESVFSLSVKLVPQSGKPAPESNYVQFAFANTIKLFWRPKGLKGEPSEAYKLLTFRRKSDLLEAVNPTEYHITIKTLKIGGVNVDNPDYRMVPPKGTQTWKIPDSANGIVTYTTINDFGGITPPVTSPLQ
ncbi:MULTISPECIES: fimbrial biogenesis chaperone [Enterobacter]|uniref:fimbrial biogenesis chaperone n=1 Tax=Enterobacter TaxID=547 RepID=UPI000B7D6A28|nr:MULTISPECIES: molecular chaperone [Enterobacter]OXL38355.1 pilus assembly protein [Enterobacter mori]